MNCDYCTSCGGKVEYLLNKPNFCPSCGAAMGGGVAKASLPNKSPQPIRQKIQRPDPSSVDTEDPDGVDIDYVPSIQGLQYELEGDYNGIGKNHGTIGSLFNNANPDMVNTPSPAIPQSSSQAKAKKEPVRKKPRKQVMPDAIKQSMKDCGSSAESPTDVG